METSNIELDQKNLHGLKIKPCLIINALSEDASFENKKDFVDFFAQKESGNINLSASFIFKNNLSAYKLIAKTLCFNNIDITIVQKKLDIFMQKYLKEEREIINTKTVSENIFSFCIVSIKHNNEVFEDSFSLNEDALGNPCPTLSHKDAILKFECIVQKHFKIDPDVFTGVYDTQYFYFKHFTMNNINYLPYRFIYNDNMVNFDVVQNIFLKNILLHFKKNDAETFFKSENLYSSYHKLNEDNFKEFLQINVDNINFKKELNLSELILLVLNNNETIDSLSKLLNLFPNSLNVALTSFYNENKSSLIDEKDQFIKKFNKTFFVKIKDLILQKKADANFKKLFFNFFKEQSLNAQFIVDKRKQEIAAK